MSCYTLDHVIEECIYEKSATNSMGSSQKSRAEIFYESWAALNSWIESRICKRKGASISMLGSFTWEFKHSQSDVDFRPIFIIADSFAKDHLVRRPRIHQIPIIAPGEEINFSTLAIKFSKSLTKDMIFSGIRDIIKKIGQYIDRMYEFEIEFSFGTLSSKERKVKFEFNQSRLEEILPENTNGLYMPDFAEMRNHVGSSGSLTMNCKGLDKGFTMSNSTSSRKLPNLSFAASRPEDSDEAWSDRNPYESSRPNDQIEPESTKQNDSYNDQTVSISQNGDLFNGANTRGSSTWTNKEEMPLSPRLQEILLALDDPSFGNSVKRSERGQVARERVIEQAYVRCLTDTESQAKHDDELNATEEKLYKQWLITEKKKREDMRSDAKSLRETLDWQLHESNKRLEQEATDRKNAKMSCLLPITAGARPRPSEDFFRGLKHQIQSNADRKASDRQRTMQEEREYLDHIAMELDMQSAVERANHLEKQQVLLEAWERDGHIRNLKRLQVAGASAVKSYIDTNLPDASMLLSTRGKTGTGAQFGAMSVGFDSRRGRK